MTMTTQMMTELEPWIQAAVQGLLSTKAVNRGEWQAQSTASNPAMATRELRHLTLKLKVPGMMIDWQRVARPNLPWAEDHFQERVSGKPWNPPPSSEWWPYARNNNADHKHGEIFSHTYPERFWPKQAGRSQGSYSYEGLHGNLGIRYEYGDLGDLVQVLTKNPLTRQAYLPVWFPEDLRAIQEGQRVPCTLGYHFLLNPETQALDVTYLIRSCDLIRHFRDDVYMAGRLLQWVRDQVNSSLDEWTGETLLTGQLVMHISSLHIFEPDVLSLNVKRAQAARA